MPFLPSNVAPISGETGTSDDVETMENDDRLHLAAQKGTISWETGTVDDVETMIILNLAARKKTTFKCEEQNFETIKKNVLHRF